MKLLLALLAAAFATLTQAQAVTSVDVVPAKTRVPAGCEAAWLGNPVTANKELASRNAKRNRATNDLAAQLKISVAQYKQSPNVVLKAKVNSQLATLKKFDNEHRCDQANRDTLFPEAIAKSKEAAGSKGPTSGDQSLDSLIAQQKKTMEMLQQLMEQNAATQKDIVSKMK